MCVEVLTAALSPESEEDEMPLNESDKAWVRETINDAYKAQGWGKLRRFIKEWSGTGAVIAVLILALTQYTSYVEFRTHSNDALSTINSFNSDLSGQIRSTSANVQSLDTRLTKLEGAVKVIADKKSDQTQKLVHDLLSAARNVTQAGGAPQLLTVAGSLVAVLQSEKLPANPKFFKDQIDTLNEIEKAHTDLPEAFAARVALAQYRSSQESVPDLRPQVLVTRAIDHAIVIHHDNRVPNDVPIEVSGMVFYISLVTGNAFEIEDRNANKTIIFSNDRIVGGTQTLDGIHWRNTDFMGTHIRYEGGQIELSNVHFINCTFEVPSRIAPTHRARRFLDYAALVQPELTFSGE